MSLAGSSEFMAGLPQLDIYTLSEDFALAKALEQHWEIVARSMGVPASRWIDSAGARMYCAVVALRTGFDLDAPVLEDDRVAAETTVTAVRKPHSLSTTVFRVGGTARAEVRMLTSFIKRVQARSNKRFSKVNELWDIADFDTDEIESYLDEHHQRKRVPQAQGFADSYRVNRIQDFNAADFMYFKNYVRIAKASEWAATREQGGATRLNFERSCYYYGNVGDGETVSINVSPAAPDGAVDTHIRDEDRLIFLSRSRTREVNIPER